MSSPYIPEMTFEYISPSQLAMSDISSLIIVASISTLRLPSPAFGQEDFTPGTSVASSRLGLDLTHDDYQHPLTLIDSLELYRCHAASPEGSITSSYRHSACFVKVMGKAVKGAFKGGFRRAKLGCRAAARKCGKCVGKQEGSDGYGSDECSGSEAGLLRARPMSPWCELEDRIWQERCEDARW